MKAIHWESFGTTGIPTLDQSHRHLIDIFNRLYAACFASQGDVVLEGIVDELLAYTKEHFAQEDHILHKCGVPDYSDHTRDHARLVGRLVRVRHQLEEGDPHALSMETLTFIHDWISEHIRETDRRCAEHLHECIES